MLSLLHREGGPFTLMETELQDGGLAVYPRTKVLFQPTDRTNPHVSCYFDHDLQCYRKAYVRGDGALDADAGRRLRKRDCSRPLASEPDMK